MRRWLALFLCAVGCAVGYVPEPVHHTMPLEGGAFECVLEVLRDRYRRIAVADREAFRLQTAWVPFQQGDQPGHRRATVFRDAGGQLQVVVEARYIGVDGGGMPLISPVCGDRRAEEELAGQLERALR